MAASLPFESLHELDDAFLALLKNGAAEQFVYTNIKSDTQIELFNGETALTAVAIERFKDLYNGKVVIINSGNY